MNDFLGTHWIVCGRKRNPCAILYSVNRSQILADYSENHNFEKRLFLSDLQQNIEETQKYIKYHLFMEKSDYRDYLIPALEKLFLEVELTDKVPSFVQIELKDAQYYSKPKSWFQEEHHEGNSENGIAVI